MITHNLHQALKTGNRTLMMADGRIILDLKGEERESLTMEELLKRFREGAKEELDDDRILLSDH
jgi:putative ABC transport system ATP-binding protein